MENKMLGKIINLFISKNGCKDRINQSELVVDTNGVFVDKFYGKNIDRSILITSIDSYDIAQEQNIYINDGQLGENIIVDFNLKMLKLNIKIKIGEVILEISQHCTICNSLSAIDKKLPKLLANDRGVFAKVLKGGIIKQNDIVEYI
jgi:MOSC domain-containing protein YiiM